MANELQKLLDEIKAGANQPKEVEQAQSSTLKQPPVVEDLRSPKEKYIDTQVVPAAQIQIPSFNFQETPQQREDRIAREQAMNERLGQAKIDYEKALQDASDREFKQGIWAAIGNALPGVVAGATAMNTKASVKPSASPNIQVKDLTGAADKKYKTDYENILKQYKQLQSGELTAKDRANLEARAGQMYLTGQAIAGNLEQRAANARNVEEDRFDRKVTELGKATENNAKAYNALSAIDDVLSNFGIDNIDNLQVKGNKVTDSKGKEVDLPGVSVPGLGRFTIGNQPAQTLESAMATVFNTELKDRSGAAVTTPELERLKTEFGQGKFNTESQMISALQRYKKLAYQALKNAEARYESPIVDEYKARGGITSDSFSTKGSNQPQKSIVKKEYSPSRNQTRITYSDGTTEIKDGK